MTEAWRTLTECAAKQGLDELCSEAGTMYEGFSSGTADDAIRQLVAECRGRATNDEDLDGLSDDQDQCPSDKETVNGYRDRDGCPESIEFTAADGVELQAASSELVGRLAPRRFGAVRTRLVVYVDGNAELARRRALAIREALTARGWNPELIDAVGSDTGLPDADQGELLRFENFVLIKQ